MCLPAKGAQRQPAKGDTFTILPFQQAPGTEEVVERILLEPASLSRACGAQGKRLPHLDQRTKVAKALPLETADGNSCSEKMGDRRGTS